MPYPTEHACRIKDPDAFQEGSFRRIERGEGDDKLSIIIGRLKGETTTTTQAYRYDKERWTEARARTHCEEAEGTFEPASEEAKLIDITTVDTLAKAYAAHNKIHAEYVDARWGARRKATMQEDHESVVRRILELGGKHIPKGEALDETLPEDLREAFKLYYIADGFVLSEDKPPRSTIQILRTGEFHHPAYGKFVISDDTLANMLKNFNESRPVPPTEMVVDYEHMGAAEPPVLAPAAGWVKGLSIVEGALFADVEWTEAAAEKIGKREYRFISPEFNLQYKDKETGKNIGATLLSVALTNRPFLEGMEPVALSEGAVLCVEPSYGEHESKVRWAYDQQYGSPAEVGGMRDWVTEVYEDYCIVDRQGVLYKLPYTLEEDIVRFDKDNEEKVQKTYVALMELNAAAQVAGVGKHKELPGAGGVKAGDKIQTEGDIQVDKELREALGLSEDADLLVEVKAVKARAESAESKVSELEGQITAAEGKTNTAENKLTAIEVEGIVQEALGKGKLTPKMTEWAKVYCLADRQGFLSYLETAEKVGPELKVLGNDGEPILDIKLTDLEQGVAKRLGVSSEDMLKAKEAAQPKQQ